MKAYMEPLDLGDIIFTIDDVPFTPGKNKELAVMIINELENLAAKHLKDVEIAFEVHGAWPGCTNIRIKAKIKKLAVGLSLVASILTIGEFTCAAVEHFKENYNITIIDHTIKKTATVKKGDSLSEIAREFKPRSCSLEQYMVATYIKNTKAFYKDNINCLSAEKTLLLPTLDMMKFISREFAESTVEKHNREFADQKNDF